MKKQDITILLLLLTTLSACIGDDIIDDTQEPELRFVAAPRVMLIDESLALTTLALDATGRPIAADVVIVSTDRMVATITDDTVLTAIDTGTTEVIATTTINGEDYTDAFLLNVTTDTTALDEVKERTGKLRTTSSYDLEGSFKITEIDDGIVIELADDYIADRALPGLYAYLTNNPATTSGALEIGRVEIFDGAHNYLIPDLQIDAYSHLLYFCKPFNVKVGDGEILN